MSWMTDELERRRRAEAARLLKSAHHEAGHAVINHLTGARVSWVTLVRDERRVGLTQASFVGVDLADVLVGFAAGRAATKAMGWPKPESGAEDDERRERLVAIQLAHLMGQGKATDPEYVDAVVAAGRREADRLAEEHWQAIDAVAKILVQRLRVGGAEEVGAMIDRALLKVPAYAAREAAFTLEWDRMMVRYGFARSLTTPLRGPRTARRGRPLVVGRRPSTAPTHTRLPYMRAVGGGEPAGRLIRAAGGLSS